MKRRPAAAISSGDLTPRKRRRRVVESVLVVFGCVVLGDSLIGEHGLPAIWLAREEARAEQRRLIASEAETIRLREEMRLLESDWSTIEDVARRELRLIKPGEKLFIIRDVPPTGQR